MRRPSLIVNQPTNILAVNRDLQRAQRITITPTNLSTAPSPDRGRRKRHLRRAATAFVQSTPRRHVRLIKSRHHKPRLIRDHDMQHITLNLYSDLNIHELTPFPPSKPPPPG